MRRIYTIWTKTFSREQNITRNFKQDITFGKSTQAEIPAGNIQCLPPSPQTSATMGIGDTATRAIRWKPWPGKGRTRLRLVSHFCPPRFPFCVSQGTSILFAYTIRDSGYGLPHDHRWRRCHPQSDGQHYLWQWPTPIPRYVVAFFHS